MYIMVSWFRSRTDWKALAPGCLVASYIATSEVAASRKAWPPQAPQGLSSGSPRGIMHQCNVGLLSREPGVAGDPLPVPEDELRRQLRRTSGRPDQDSRFSTPDPLTGERPLLVF